MPTARFRSGSLLNEGIFRILHEKSEIIISSKTDAAASVGRLRALRLICKTSTRRKEHRRPLWLRSQQ
jgi:hypothetical protein